jgi:aminoglycoside phosphotransferase family enzyme
MAQLQISKNLTQWLDLSWFYPEGFKKREIKHSLRSCTVVGESLSYRFQKYGADCSIADKIERCRAELQLNKELAPDLYLGAKLLKWVDEEPHWFTQEFSASVLSRKESFEAEEIGLVMRTISQRNLLSHRIESERYIEPRFISKIARLMQGFYQRRKREGIRAFLNEPREGVALIQQRYIDQLETVRCHSDFGDFFNVVVSYCQGRLISEFHRAQDVFYQRGQTGKIVEIHADLRMENICIEPLCEAGKSINIFGRYQSVIADELEDIAELYVDFLAQGCREQAELLKQYFLTEGDDIELHVFRLLVALKCFTRVHKALQGSKKITIDARALISMGFLSTLGIEQPIVIALESEAIKYRSILAAFLDCPETLGRLEDDFISNLWVKQDQRYLKTLQHIEEQISQGLNVVLDQSISTSEQRITLSRRLENLGARLIFLHVDETKPVVQEEVFGFTNIVSNGFGSTEHWNLSKKELDLVEAWGLVSDFLIRALSKNSVKTGM